MKKYFRWSILLKAALLVAGLSAILALINLALYNGGTFYVGFPGRFLTVYLGKGSPAFHVSLSGLALDLLLAYAVCWFLDAKKHRGRRDSLAGHALPPAPYTQKSPPCPRDTAGFHYVFIPFLRSKRGLPPHRGRSAPAGYPCSQSEPLPAGSA